MFGAGGGLFLIIRLLHHDYIYRLCFVRFSHVLNFSIAVDS